MESIKAHAHYWELGKMTAISIEALSAIAGAKQHQIIEIGEAMGFKPFGHPRRNLMAYTADEGAKIFSKMSEMYHG